MRFCAHTDLDPGKVLTTQFLDNGLNAVVTAGGTIGPDAKSSGLQGNIIEQNDDPLGRDIIICTQLQDTPAGQIHKSLGFQQKQFCTLIGNLTVQSLKLTFINLAAEILSQQIDGHKTAVVAGMLILLAWIAKTNNQPAFRSFSTKHSLEQIGNRGATVNMRNGPGKNGGNIQLLDLAAGTVG